MFAATREANLELLFVLLALLAFAGAIYVGVARHAVAAAIALAVVGAIILIFAVA